MVRQPQHSYWYLVFIRCSVTFDFSRIRGFSTMALLCMQCKKSFPVHHLFEVLHCAAGTYFFCSEECSDKWVFPFAHKKESGNQEQLSTWLASPLQNSHLRRWQAWTVLTGYDQNLRLLTEQKKVTNHAKEKTKWVKKTSNWNSQKTQSN